MYGFLLSLSQLAQAVTSLQSAAAASECVFEFLGEEEPEVCSFLFQRGPARAVSLLFGR